MQTQSALVVDDERDIRELLVVALTRMGLRVETAATVSAAKQQLAHQPFDLCLTDMRLPDGNGMEILAHITANYPSTPAAMITAFGSVDSAVEALKAGAFDFVSKPIDLGVLRDLVRHALKLRSERSSTGRVVNTNEPAAANEESPQTGGEATRRMQGRSPAMEQLRQTIAKVARSQAPVYIWGESGTGKELTARSIHEQSPRAAGPFIPVNCGAIPAELMESEFFGHKKGSFTGAHADKDGLFKAASGGTLFLDEVAELPLSMQVKLLRAIQEKTVRPVGAAAEVKVDVRILSATHKDLARLVDEGKFRHDLYYRINVIELRVPPLRNRREDLPMLADNILTRLGKTHGMGKPSLSPSALAALNAYPFPGNIRELENLLERAMTMADGEHIQAEDLHLPAITQPFPIEAPSPASHYGALPPTPSAHAMPANPSPVVNAPPLPASNHLSTLMEEAEGDLSLTDAVEQMERATIEQALLANRYNKTKTAAQLGITFRALRYRLKKLGIE